MKRILILVFAIIAGFESVSQNTDFDNFFRIETPNYTVEHGDNFRSMLFLKKPFLKDSLKIKLYFRDLLLPIEKGKATIDFLVFHKDFGLNDNVLEQFIPLALKTDSDSIIYKLQYFTKPNIAYIRSLNNPPIVDFEIYPDQKPVLFRTTVKDEIIKEFIKLGEKGHLVITYLISDKGKLSHLQIFKNNFPFIAKEKLESFLTNLEFIPGRVKNKDVSTLDFTIVQIK